MCHPTLTSGEAGVGSLQGSVLPQTVEQRHHRDALLTAFPLSDAVHFTISKKSTQKVCHKKMRVNGSVAPDIRMRPRNISPRDIMSYAPNPSMDVDVTVTCGRFPSTLATHAPHTRTLPVLSWRVDTGWWLVLLQGSTVATWCVPPNASPHSPPQFPMLGQCRQLAHSDGVDDCLRHLTSGYPLCEIWNNRCNPQHPARVATNVHTSCLKSEISVEHVLVQIDCGRWNTVQHFWWQRFPWLGRPPGCVRELPQSGLITRGKCCSFQSLACR